ncbi:fibronectin type III domain-containing protein 11 [Tympanuchus pallidicinctus]|uniref:fibronectin type III domain-containing protein 11 n=1 Tax=Tympanuchus pallidicinctus TaxID=109042 RepID=UPI00228706EF|nr:fibronectin type III domain-containing protein 11 [Tympanuchus pallidicinctus]
MRLRQALWTWSQPGHEAAAEVGRGSLAGQGEGGLPEVGQANFGIMNVNLNELESNSENTVDSTKEQGNAICRRYTERSSLVRQYLQADLSLHLLEAHQKKVELLKKCCYYIEVLPTFLILRDQNLLAFPTSIFQVIDPWKFQRVKKMGRSQTEIHLQLLTYLLEELQQGREELVCYVETCDMVTFLSKWDSIKQRMSDLSEVMNNFNSVQVSRRLYTKHRLVSCADIRGNKIPDIRLFLCAKMPVLFDRNESYAHKNWAHLKWSIENQESSHEQYELHFKLLKRGTQAEFGHCGLVTRTTNTCVVQGLLPDRSYEFIIRRAEVYTLVYELWYDTITLTTKANTAEDKSA